MTTYVDSTCSCGKVGKMKIPGQCGQCRQDNRNRTAARRQYQRDYHQANKDYWREYHIEYSRKYREKLREKIT